MVRYNFFLLSVMLLACSLLCHAQKKLKIAVGEAESVYYATYDESVNDAKRKALQRATSEAINNAFPGQLNAETTMLEESKSSVNGESRSAHHFHQSILQERRGIWMKDLKAPQYKLFLDEQNEQLVVTCSVKGEVREIPSGNRPTIKWMLLRNNPDDRRTEAKEFNEGDNLYLTFQAPCDGYLAVCMGNGMKMVECLIPTTEEPNGIYRIKANKEYIFFSEKHSNRDDMIAPEPISMYCDTPPYEDCTMYVLFSETKFTQAMSNKPKQRVKLDDGSEYERSPQLTVDDFLDWLNRTLTHDPNMVQEKCYLRIKK